MEAVWALVARLQLALWVERVPSAGNPADPASRGAVAQLRTLRPCPTVVTAPEDSGDVAWFLRGGDRRQAPRPALLRRRRP